MKNHCFQVVHYQLSLIEGPKNPANLWGKTPLHYAANEGHLEVVKLFMNQPLECKSPKDHLGDTPLHLAARSGHLEVVKYLLTQVEDQHTQNSYGLTPADKASKMGHFSIVNLLSE